MPSEVSIVSGHESVEELRRQLTEAREQQAVTAEILRVISSAPMTDLPHVFAQIATSAARFCDANDALILQVEGELLQLVAHHGPIFTPNSFFLSRAISIGRAVLDRRTVHIPDLQAEIDEYPEGSDRAQHLGVRTVLNVPLIRGGRAIGVIGIRRTEVRLFSDKQIVLLETFADQAVIAIENMRLFEEVQARTNELSQSLEQQTATAEILRVISHTPTDVQPVFEAIVRRASSLCGGEYAIVTRYDGMMLHLAAQHNARPGADVEVSKFYPQVPRRDGSISGRALVNRAVVHISDIEAEQLDAVAHDAYRRIGLRAVIAVPMLHDGHPIGVVAVSRETPGSFSNLQIELLRTFANQAVIAVENAQMFERIVQKSHELELASQHKSQFVANMSHELRTPLAAILGFAELIQEGFYGPLPDKSMDALTRIRSNGKHLLALINSVLDIAKIESGQFSLNLAEYALESVVETVRSATEALAETKKLALKTDVVGSLPIGLGDEQRLTQVLLNLVGNAIKFTDSGEVRVTAKAVNGHFAVSVMDTGPGIPEQEQKRIFEQFHQVDSTLTKAKGGTGLGLAIAKQIVEMHGGRIWVESTIGKGATFQMEVPTRAEFRKSAP